MPASIPYHPSLILGNIIDPAVLDKLSQISSCQALIEAAHDKLLSFMAMKRSIDMTIQELANLNIDTKSLIDKSVSIQESIITAANDYASVRIEQENQIQQIKGNMNMVGSGLESPVDYDKSRIREMPLSADSLSMDVQYFSFNENEKRSATGIATIRDYIKAATSILGDDTANRISSTATTQISQQMENHEISGTLIITASCTHKNAVLLQPLVLDVDKAITAWNTLFTADAIPLQGQDVTTMQKMAGDVNAAGRSFSLLSGTTYGSSFVGMVHILRKENTQTLPPEMIKSIQEQFTVGKWVAKESGGFGIDPTFSHNIKSLLSSQSISSHVTITTMGVVPSIKQNEVRIGVKAFADVDPQKMANELSVLSKTTDDMKTISSTAAKSQTGAEMLAIKGASVQNVMQSLQKIDEAANRVLDINSMMTAFEDYINRVNAGKAGVPIQYFLKPINKAKLASLWMEKYYPSSLSADSNGAVAANAK